MNLILLGAPGAGKGTQADVISKLLNIPTISTGNIIREAIKSNTKLGSEAKAFVDAGKLVPDAVVIGIIKDRLKKDDCKEGFILDGFPRTVPQAEELDRMGVTIDKVIEIYVQDEIIADRISGRRVCEKCGASYHIIHRRSKDGKTCDLDGGRLIQRDDDRPEIVLKRLSVYHNITEPLKDYYDKQGKLRIVTGQEDVIHTTAHTIKAVIGP